MSRQLTIQDYMIMQVEDEKKLAEAHRENRRLHQELIRLNSEKDDLVRKLEEMEKALRIIRQATNETSIEWCYDE